MNASSSPTVSPRSLRCLDTGVTVVPRHPRDRYTGQACDLRKRSPGSGRTRAANIPATDVRSWAYALTRRIRTLRGPGPGQEPSTAVDDLLVGPRVDRLSFRCPAHLVPFTVGEFPVGRELLGPPQPREPGRQRPVVGRPDVRTPPPDRPRNASDTHLKRVKGPGGRTCVRCPLSRPDERWPRQVVPISRGPPGSTGARSIRIHSTSAPLPTYLSRSSCREIPMSRR